MKNDGKDSEKAFFDHWYARGHIERIRDAKDLMGINGGRRVADFKKPSDFLVSAPGVPLHYAEVKSTIDGVSFGFGKIQDGQAKAAQLEYLKGAEAYKFYIFSYPLGRWYIMDCGLYCHQLKMGRRSVKFVDLPQWIK